MDEFSLSLFFAFFLTYILQKLKPNSNFRISIQKQPFGGFSLSKITSSFVIPCSRHSPSHPCVNAPAFILGVRAEKLII